MGVAFQHYLDYILAVS